MVWPIFKAITKATVTTETVARLVVLMVTAPVTAIAVTFNAPTVILLVLQIVQTVPTVMQLTVPIVIVKPTYKETVTVIAHIIAQPMRYHITVPLAQFLITVTVHATVLKLFVPSCMIWV
jgi:hypothetical protein